MEIADAQAQDQEDIFIEAGQEEGEDQPFNTNIFYINETLLNRILNKLVQRFNALGIDGENKLKEIISPTYIEKDPKRGEDGNLYIPIDGAIGTAMHNLNTFFLLDPMARDVLAEVKAEIEAEQGGPIEGNFDRLLHFVPIPRTKFFTPVKNNFDLTLQNSDYYTFEVEKGWVLQDAQRDSVPPEIELSPDSFWGEQQNHLHAFGDRQHKLRVRGLRSLNIQGKVFLKGAYISGDVKIVNHTDDIIDLNAVRYKNDNPELFQDGKLNLKDIVLSINEDGNITTSQFTTTQSGPSTSSFDAFHLLRTTLSEQSESNGSPGASSPVSIVGLLAAAAGITGGLYYYWRRHTVSGNLYRLGSSSDSVRRSAARALGRLGDTRAVEPLIERLVDGNWDVRRAAAAALGRLGDKSAVEPLIERLKEQMVEGYIKALGSSGWFYRREAADALGKLGDKRAVAPLIKRLGDRDNNVRSAAARALGELGDGRALEVLERVLANTEWSEPYEEYFLYGEILTVYHPNHALYTALKAAIAQLRSIGSSPVTVPVDTDMIDAIIKHRRVSVDGIRDENLRKFLIFLRNNGLTDIVVMGGFIKSLVFGEEINDLDISYKAALTDGQRTRLAPLNAAVSEDIFAASQRALAALADKLGVSVSQFLPPHVGVERGFRGLNVDYFGPLRDASGRVMKRSLFDAVTGEGYFSNTTAGLLRLGIDADGNIYGDVESLRSLKDGRLTIWGDGSNFGINDILRILRLKHQYGLAVSDADYQTISNRAGQYQRMQLPDLAVRIAREQVGKLLAAAQNVEEAKEELARLGLTGLLMNAGGPRESNESSSSPVVTSDDSRTASDELGGIDMNDINVDRQGGGVEIQFDPAMIQQIIDMDIDGFAPVIINVVPLPSVLPLLGLEPKREEEFALSQTG
jgi:hypothetical protein